MKRKSKHRTDAASARSCEYEFIQPDSDDRFAYIVGYTEGGFPYGTTWDELWEIGRAEGASMSDKKLSNASNATFREWAPDIDKWPRSWMGVKEDLEYGRKLLPYLEQFLQELYDEGLSRKTFVQYRDNLWLLGGSIITGVSNFEEYREDPLKKLYDSVVSDGILPDHYDDMSEAELNAFARMCRRFEKFLDQRYGTLFL